MPRERDEKTVNKDHPHDCNLASFFHGNVILSLSMTPSEMFQSKSQQIRTKDAKGNCSFHQSDSQAVL